MPKALFDRRFVARNGGILMLAEASREEQSFPSWFVTSACEAGAATLVDAKETPKPKPKKGE